MIINDYITEKEKEFPRIVHVETTNVCNLKCIHCPQYDLSKLESYKPKYMDTFIFDKIVNEVSSHNGILRLTPDGEPTLHPNWVEQVDKVLKSNTDIFCFNTNGSLIENEKMDILFRDTNVKIAVEFSIDSLYESSYKKIRGGDYKKLLKNIFNFINEIEKKRANNIKTMVSCIIQPELENGEYDDFVKFWTPLVDKIITRHYVDTKGLTPKKPEVQKLYQDRWPCPVVFSRIVIGMDGEIRFCPDDWEKNTVVGNLSSDTIKSIWDSKFMNELRDEHICNNIKNKVCKQCTDWTVIKWGNDYVKALSDIFQKEK